MRPVVKREGHDLLAGPRSDQSGDKQSGILVTASQQDLSARVPVVGDLALHCQSNGRRYYDNDGGGDERFRQRRGREFSLGCLEGIGVTGIVESGEHEVVAQLIEAE